jgi:purine-nucleoside phosphorylase
MTREPSLPSHDLEARVRDAVAAVRTRSPLEPRVAVTLGSGLGGVIDAIERDAELRTADLPHWPRSTVAGHSGRLALGRWAGVPVVLLSGRSHRYEGYTMDRVTFAVRVMHGLGARIMIFTNAVGGLHPDWSPADLMLATDHLNFIGRRGLLTPREIADRGPARRVAHPHDPELRARLEAAAVRAKVPVRKGVLMGSHGPSYETAAEVRMATDLGADAVCMSTVHEVTVAAELGCPAASISCITNLATGLGAGALSHEDVTEVANRAAGKMRAMLDEFMRDEAGGR